MKYILFFYSVFLCSVGFSAPRVGDFAVYKTTDIFACGEQMEESSKSLQVVDVSQDASGKEYLRLLTRVQVGSGPVSVYESFLEASHFYDGREFSVEADLQTYCRGLKNSAMETISVPAGHFSTCVFSEKTDYGWTIKTWLGPVALGIVKRVARSVDNNNPSCPRISTDELRHQVFAN